MCYLFQETWTEFCDYTMELTKFKKKKVICGTESFGTTKNSSGHIIIIIIIIIYNYKHCKSWVTRTDLIKHTGVFIYSEKKSISFMFITCILRPTLWLTQPPIQYGIPNIFPQGLSGRGVVLTTHPHVAPSYCMILYSPPGPPRLF